MFRLSIRLSKEQKQKIEEIAQAEGITVSEWVRGIIDQNLDMPKAESIYSEFELSQAKAVYETRILTRLVLSRLNHNREETNEIINKVRIAAKKLLHEVAGE